MRLAIALLVALLLAGCNPGPEPESTATPTHKLGTIEGFKLQTPDGKPVVFDPNDSSKVTVLSFWSVTWNPENEAHLDLLNELYERYGNKGLRIIAIAYDEKPEAVKAVMEKRILPFEVAMGTKELYERFKLTSIPATFVVSPGGALRKRLEGLQTVETLTELIKPELPGRSGNR
ncbi:MAG: TlpA family protein disulfide reductase [Candidatus Eremiobacteraeota bacterium]|nr:TlpA family protein disulfide reductase [Candidatus Eremiobacteraeota bacterium]